jgi:iron only hydrogenase large subunit-like protein
MSEEIYMNKLDDLIKAIEDEKKKGKVLVAQLAPAVRITIGEEFGHTAGEELTNKCVGLLKELGFNYVLDTPLGADICVYEEVPVFKQLLDSNDLSYFPMFNSCCIGWKMYCKRMHLDLYPHLSKIGSPNQVIGSVAKNYLSHKIGKYPEDICVVSIMPCTLKKFETIDTFDHKVQDKIMKLKYVDYVLTTVELAEWTRKKQIDFNNVKENELMLNASKEGTIFGVTGGVTESFLTAFAKYLGEEKNILEFRNDDNSKTSVVQIGKYKINVAIVYGVGQLEKILERIEQGEFFHFIEVMYCPSGCVGGPGQPQASESVIAERAKAMRACADKIKRITCFDDSALKQIYSDLNMRAHSAKSEKLFFLKD